MADYDVFNGDADGLCALVQLRLVEPRAATLVTGIKRDIELLERVDARAGDRVTVLDVSMEKNQAGLRRALDAGASVLYVDHHVAGEIPEHAQLTAIIDESASTCTSLLVDAHLGGAYHLWAITGAFGDNLQSSAHALAERHGVAEPVLRQLDTLGVYLNYNGYGSHLDELHFRPDELFEKLRPYSSPLELIAAEPRVFDKLEQGYREDMALAAALSPARVSESSAAYLLPDAAWCRRCSGVFGNALSNDNPRRAHAVITPRAGGEGGYAVSVRAPKSTPRGAAELCKQFPSGGGRAGAAGINALPEDQLEHFLAAFAAQYS